MRIIRYISVILRIAKDPLRYSLRKDDIISKFTNLNLAYKLNDGSIYDLTNSRLIDIKYEIVNENIITKDFNTQGSAGYIYPRPIYHYIDYAPIDYNAIDVNHKYELEKYHIKSEANNSFFSDVKLISITIASSKHGYSIIPIEDIVELSPNGINPMYIYPEIEYSMDINGNIKHLGINSLFTDYEILTNTHDLDINNDSYLIHSFGYSIDHSLKLRINSIVLRSQSTNKIHICSFKEYLIADQPKVFNIK